MNRTTAKHLFLLALAVSLFYWKTLLTRQFTMLIGTEAVNYTYSWLHFWISSIRHGHLPLWDPYGFSGRPFAGEMLTAAFDPLHLVLVLIPFNRDGLFSPRLYDEMMIVMHLLGAYFMFALVRELRLARLSAFVGACCFALSGMVVRFLWPPYVESAIWLPAIVLFLIRMLHSEQVTRVALNASLAGACLGMSILAGGLHMAILEAIVIVTVLAYFAATSRLPWTAQLSGGSHWLRVAVMLTLALAVAGGIGAVQLLPSMEYSRLSLRWIVGGVFPSSLKIPYDRLNSGMWPQSVITLLFPLAFDGKIGDENWVRAYIGVFPFFMALIGIWKRWSNTWVRYLTGLAVAAFAYSFAEFSPLHGVLYALVPFLWLAREAGRFLYLAQFALAVLAAFGLDALLDKSRTEIEWIPAKRVLKWISICCGAGILLPGLYSQFSLSIWNCLSLLLILASCGWIVYLLRKPAGAFVQVLLVVFILFDLDAFQWLEANNIGLRTGDKAAEMASLKGAIGFIKSQPGVFRVQVPFKDPTEDPPNVGDAYQVQTVWGGGGTQITDYYKIWTKENLLGVRYRIKPATTNDAGAVYEDSRWKVYENTQAFPRAWVVHKSLVETSTDGVFRRMDDSGTDLRQVAVMETRLPVALASEMEREEPVLFRKYEANSLQLDVNAKAAGLLVLTDVFYPGWQATVNGKSVLIYKVDGALRGVLLQPGENQVTMEYAPFSFYLGATVTLLTIVGISFMAALNWRSNRSQIHAQVQPNKILEHGI
jgi:hypothetical protein